MKNALLVAALALASLDTQATSTEISLESVNKDPEVTEQQDSATPTSQQAEAGEWDVSVSLGYGQVESIIKNVEDYNLYLLPNISYYGEDFFVENTTLGYSLYEGQDLYVDLVGLLNRDGLYFKLEDFGIFSALGINPVRGRDVVDIDRDLSYLAGLSATYHVLGLDIRGGYYHDITDVHGGYEVSFSIAKHFSLTDNWTLDLKTTALHKSKKLLDYYYTIRREEAFTRRPFYTPNSPGNSYSWTVNSEYSFNENWSAHLLLNRVVLPNEITNSIIVGNKRPNTYFLGVKYTF